MADESLDRYPEAIPLRRVAPGWRTFGVMTGLATLCLFLLVVFLGLQMVRHVPSLAATPGWPPVPMPMPASVVVTPLDEDADAQAVRGDLPYPVREDLRQPLDGPAPRTLSPRERFLKQSQTVWKAPSGHALHDLTVAPDGLSLAYFHETTTYTLVVGAINAPQVIDLETPNEVRQRQVRGVPAPVTDRKRRPELRPLGVPTWSADSQSVFFANAGGHMFRLQSTDQTLHPLELRGRAPAPMANEPSKIVFIRARPTAKVAWDTIDPTEIVLADLDTKQQRVVVPAGSRTWVSCMASPDGTQLAAVAEEAVTHDQRRCSFLYLIRMTDGKLDRLGPAAVRFSYLSWAPDGKAVAYVRTQEPLPADCLRSLNSVGTEGVFVWDSASRKEMRLSRGGGFTAPTITTQGDLFFVANNSLSGDSNRTTLRQAPLAAVRQFAATEPEGAARRPTAWLELANQVGAETKVAADGSTLDAEALGRLANTFRQRVRERFKEDIPDAVNGLSRFERELQDVPCSAAEHATLSFVFGALQGDYLRRKHGATWQLSAGPVNGTGRAVDAENAFACAVNPFQPWPSFSLEGLLNRAEGRALILVNDSAKGREAIAAQVDPDLERAIKLLKEGNVEEGEGVLLALVDRDAHQKNRYLAVLVGKLLYEHGRKDALRRFLERLAERGVVSAGLFNLQGLLLLEKEPRQAIGAFKKALRCDLHWEAAYVNLAQAYETVGESAAARTCLRRYLELFAQRPLAADVLLRLGKLQPLNKEN